MSEAPTLLTFFFNHSFTFFTYIHIRTEKYMHVCIYIYIYAGICMYVPCVRLKCIKMNKPDDEIIVFVTITTINSTSKNIILYEYVGDFTA